VEVSEASAGRLFFKKVKIILKAVLLKDSVGVKTDQ
jgi:hypothetical protein